MRAAVLVFSLTLALLVPSAFAGPGDSQCTADVNGDGIVNVQDLLQVFSEWGTSGFTADINGDGIVDILDLLEVFAQWGCEWQTGPVTTLSGFVTNLWTGDGIPDAEVTVGTEVLLTGPDGSYSGEFEVGIHDVTFEADNFISQETSIVLFPDINATLDADLEPVAAVIVSVQVSGDTEPGGTVDATAVVDIYDGSTIDTFAWSQIGGTPAVISGASLQTASVDLGAAFDYKEQLFHVLSEPPIDPPSGVFHGGIQDRFQVVGLSPLALEEAGLVTLGVDVTTTSGTYSAEGDLHTHIEWKPGIGVRDVPLNIPVLLHGKEQASYDWALTVPTFSNAVLADETTQYPEFTPDYPGLYSVTVTDLNAGGTATIDIYAGHWRGVIVGQDANGRPESDPACTSCHQNLIVGDMFADWKETGHAEIFTDNLNTSTHYGPNCFACHAVGYDPDVFNSGFDDAPDFQDFLAAGLLNNPGDNWTTMLSMFPDSAQLANIQCENCHGPQSSFQGVNSDAHMQNDPRISLSSDVCASCHGEPARHARFQQWQVSGHANYELAIDESQSGSCSKCHTSNGFLAALATGGWPSSVTVTWTEDEAHPQTCVTCHDPHDIGTSSGDGNNAKMRIEGTTLPLEAGFTAYGVGRGAICMTCHNSRRGLRNDDLFPNIYQTSEAARAPHGGPQTDIIMGQNGYLVDVGYRGNHSFITDVCTNCHMQVTDPPPGLSYNLSGTNHTFAADIGICSDCHSGGLNGEDLQQGVHDTMDILQGLIEDGLLDLIAAQTALGNTIDFNGEVQVADPADILDVEFSESRGRQAIAITLAAGVFGPYRMTDVDVLDPGGAVLGDLYFFAEPELIKAGWNWLMVHNDGSVGVHNPTYAYLLLGNAIDALAPGDGLFEWPAWLEEWNIENKR